MKKGSFITIIIVLVLILVLIWIFSSMTSKNIENSSTQVPIKENSVVNNTPAPELFSSSPLSQNAYLISAASFDANTKKALNGFTVTKKTLADGSTQVTLNATNPEYQTQTYVVKPGEKLYFIEQSLVDDVGGTDKNLQDDTAILVDANGYIVN